MAKLLHALALGIIGAGIIHIVIILLVPHYATSDVWSHASRIGPEYRFTVITDAQSRSITQSDPMFAVSICRFDLSDGIVRIRSQGAVPMWTLSVADKRGQTLFSLNDRNAVAGKLDVTIATPVDMIELRKDLPEDFANAIFVEADAAEAMAIVRLFTPDKSWTKTISDYQQTMTCTQI